MSSLVRGSAFALCILLMIGVLPVQFCVPNGTYRYQVQIIALRKDDGTVATQFTRGQFVFVEVKLKNIMSYAYAAEPYLLIARATYSLTMYGLGAFSGSLTTGQEFNAMPAFVIPNNAPFGSYEVKVMVFSTWPSAGGIPIAASVTTTFTVIP